jgi:capsular exopolysaccharide synthesis family protein
MNGNGVSPVPSVPQTQTPPWLNKQEEEFNLRQYLEIAQRRAIVITGVAIAALAFSIWSALNQKPTYMGNFQLLVEPVNGKNELSQLTNDNQSSKPSELDYDTQIQVLTSPELLQKPIQKLQASYPDLSYGSVIGGLKVVRLKETKIIEVDYQSADPGKTYAVLEQLSKAYLEYSLNEQQTYLRQGIQFVNKQIPPLQKQVNDLQDKLQDFRQKYGFIEPDTETANLTSQATALDQQLTTIQQSIVRARSDLNILNQENGALTVLSNSANYQNIVNQIQQVDSQIAIESTRFRPGNLNIQVLEEKKANLLPLLRQEASRVLDAKQAEALTQIQSLEIQAQAIAQAKTKLQQQIIQLPVLTREYTNLQSELQLATESLKRFLETRQSLQVEAAQQELPWQLIKEPSQPYAAPLNVSRSLLLGVIGSLVAGFAAALLLEKLDTTYHTAEALAKDVHLPILGIIPFDEQLAVTPGVTAKRKKRRRKSLIRMVRSFIKSLSKLSQKGLSALAISDTYDSASDLMEAMRVLNTNLQMLSQSSDRPIRSLIISSAMPGDGKSTVAFNWAKTAVAMGQRVLLVDADLRRPQIHAQLNLNNDQGLSDLLSGQLNPMNVIQRVAPDEKLYVLPAGQLHPDPASLLSSQRARQLLEKTHQLFDLVIYDTPPLVGLADTNLLARYANGLVLVVGLGKTDRTILKKAIDDLKAFKIPTLGLIANGQRGYTSPLKEYNALPDPSSIQAEQETTSEEIVYEQNDSNNHL